MGLRLPKIEPGSLGFLPSVQLAMSCEIRKIFNQDVLQYVSLAIWQESLLTRHPSPRTRTNSQRCYVQHPTARQHSSRPRAGANCVEINEGVLFNKSNRL